MASPTNGRLLGRLHSNSSSASRTMAAPRGTLSLLLVLSLKMNLMSALCSTLRPRRDFLHSVVRLLNNSAVLQIQLLQATTLSQTAAATAVAAGTQ